MDILRKLSLLVGAAAAALALTVTPALAQDEEVETPETVEELEELPATEEEDDNGRIALADSPRDRVGLILLGSLFAAAGFGVLTMRRQLKGEHPKASGEFRWR